MPSIPLTSSPFTEHWVAWVMLMLGASLLAVCLLQPGMYVRALHSLPTTKERDSIFVGSGTSAGSRIILVGYNIMMLAMLLQWLLMTDGRAYSFVDMLELAGCSTAVLLVRMLMQQSVAYVFFARNETETLHRHYLYLGDCLMLFLYPVLLCALFTPLPHLMITVVLAVLAVLYLAMLIYKIAVLLPMSLYSILYLPLYIITVEVLPFAVLWETAKTIMK